MAALVIGVASLGASGIPASAAASPQTAQKCQSSSAALKYNYYTSSGSIATWSKTCSGTYSLNSSGYSINANGWSGYVYFSDGAVSNFCDGETRYLGGRRVVKILMSAETIEPCL
ncbi:hypothetical protein [Streptomyces sp. NPDC057428]|uniref:hypothetical protein n=1 Tax=Streptomyces sp. NPDC057428 TaxID=3346129 RepID=UPI00368E9745